MKCLFAIVDKDGNFAKTTGKHKTPAFQTEGMANYCKRYFYGEELHIVMYEPVWEDKLKYEGHV
jgi:hypothetical protein